MNKINLREALVNLDIDTDFHYSLTELYEACDLKEEEKNKLVKMISAPNPHLAVVNSMLAEKAGVTDTICDDDLSDEDMKHFGCEVTESYDEEELQEAQSNSHPEEKQIRATLTKLPGTSKVEFDWINDGTYKNPDNHLIILVFTDNDFEDPYFANRRKWRQDVLLKLSEMGWGLEDPVEDHDSHLYLVMQKIGIKENVNEEPLKESWTTAYQEFIDLVNDMYTGDNAEEVDAAVTKLYQEHAGERDWDNAWLRWLEPSGEPEDDGYEEQVAFWESEMMRINGHKSYMPREQTNESWWEPKYDENEWEPEDIELHKSIDWKARNYRDYPVPEDSITARAIAYGLPGGTQEKEVKFIKYIRPNQIFPPYYGVEKPPFEGVLSGMYDGDKYGKYMIMNRFETQDVYDALSESLEGGQKISRELYRVYDNLLDILYEGSNADVVNNIKAAFEYVGGSAAVNAESNTYIRFNGSIPWEGNDDYVIRGSISMSRLNADFNMLAEDLTMAYYRAKLGGRLYHTSELIKLIKNHSDVELGNGNLKEGAATATRPSISYVLSKNMDKLTNCVTPNEFRDTIMKLVTDAEVDPKEIQKLQRALYSKKSVSALWSTIGTYMTGIKVSDGDNWKDTKNESKSIKEGYNGTLTDEEEELLRDIANRYVTSHPISGKWENETQHELEAIADELNVSKEDAKKLMIDYLGFREEQFNESKSIRESASKVITSLVDGSTWEIDRENVIPNTNSFIATCIEGDSAGRTFTFIEADERGNAYLDTKGLDEYRFNNHPDDTGYDLPTEIMDIDGRDSAYYITTDDFNEFKSSLKESIDDEIITRKYLFDPSEWVGNPTDIEDYFEYTPNEISFTPNVIKAGQPTVITLRGIKHYLDDFASKYGNFLEDNPIDDHIDKTYWKGLSDEALIDWWNRASKGAGPEAQYDDEIFDELSARGLMDSRGELKSESLTESSKWVQVYKKATDDYRYCGNGGRSWVARNSDHIDTWDSREAAIEDGKKNYKRGFKFGTHWDVEELTEAYVENPRELMRNKREDGAEFDEETGEWIKVDYDQNGEPIDAPETSKEWEHKDKEGRKGRIRQSDDKGGRKPLTRDQAKEIADFRGHKDDELYPVNEAINKSQLKKLPVFARMIPDNTKIYFLDDFYSFNDRKITDPKFPAYSKELAEYAEENGWIERGTDDEGDWCNVTIPAGTVLSFKATSGGALLYPPFCRGNDCVVIHSIFREYDELQKVAGIKKDVPLFDSSYGRTVETEPWDAVSSKLDESKPIDEDAEVNREDMIRAINLICNGRHSYKERLYSYLQYRRAEEIENLSDRHLRDFYNEVRDELKQEENPNFRLAQAFHLNESKSLNEEEFAPSGRGSASCKIWIDTTGIMGEPNEKYTLNDLADYWTDNNGSDPILAAYKGDWKAWLDDTISQMEEITDDSLYCESSDPKTFPDKEEAWTPDMTECPACGDTSFDSKKGKCTKCSYRESLTEANKIALGNEKYKGFMIRQDHKYGGYTVYDKHDEQEDSGFKTIEAARAFIDKLISETDKKLTESNSLKQDVQTAIYHLVKDLGRDPESEDFADDVVLTLENELNEDEIPSDPLKYREWASAIMCEVSRQLNSGETDYFLKSESLKEVLSYDKAENLRIQLAKPLKLSDYEAETFEHDINNGRAYEWLPEVENLPEDTPGRAEFINLVTGYDDLDDDLYPVNESKSIKEYYEPERNERLSTSNIIKALKSHSVDYKEKDGKVIAIEVYTKDGETFEDEVDLTNCTYQQLRDFLGY